jgi:tetratricopeptide (TPR) repeat protein
MSCAADGVLNEGAAAPRALNARYVLHERLGVGGQAEVWRAHDPERDIDIALKILRPGAGRSAAAWEALRHEYDNASRLDHPYILKVYPPERDETNFLLPMELATGGDLGRLRGASYLAVVPVLMEVAEALGHAHERGVIHRDLKPSNVLFDARGRVQLADFGVSGRSVDAGTDAMIRGLSPFSASPEQLRGEPPRPTDDIYALGALAYELLSNHPPYYPHFDARRVQEEPVPPLVPTQQIPAKLDALIMRMLAKRAGDRPASMREVMDGFDGALNDTLTFDAVPTHLQSDELPANATIQLPSDPGVRAQLARNVTMQLDELSLTMPPETVVSFGSAAVAAAAPAEPAAPAVPVPPSARPRPTPAEAQVSAAPVTDEPAAAQPAGRLEPRPYVPPMKPVWQRAPLPEVMRATRFRRGRRAVEHTLAPAGPGVLHPSVMQELRDQPVRRAPLEPMKSGMPRVFLLLVALASGTIALVTLLPKHFDAAAPAAVLAKAEAIVDRAVNPPPAAAGGAQASPAAVVPAAAAAVPVAAAVSTRFDDDGYARAAGEGFAALGAGRLPEARAAFERARALRPDGSEALDGLRRVATETQSRNFAGARSQAADLESQERWDDALNAYSGMLRKDPTLAFAQQGKARAQGRIQLDGALQDLLDHPERLSSPAVRDEATQLLQTASQEPSPGPVLSSQISRLTVLLPGSELPVHLSLVSDSQTQVAIEGVGNFGSFSQREVELKPGHYIVTGTRDGFHDVHQDVTVIPGTQSQTITVSCDEPG